MKSQVKNILKIILVTILKLSAWKVTFILFIFDRVWFIVIAPYITHFERVSKLKHNTFLLKELYRTPLKNHKDFKKAFSHMWKQRKLMNKDLKRLKDNPKEFEKLKNKVLIDLENERSKRLKKRGFK